MDINDLRRLGYAVVPGSPDKVPLVKWRQWTERPQTDAEFNALPHGSVYGIVTGKLYGLVVLDFDGADGARQLDSLGLAPNVKTGSGGHHLWVQAPPWPVKTCAGVVPGVDVRGEGGLVWVLGRSKKGPYELLTPEQHGFQPVISLLPERQPYTGSALTGTWEGEDNGTDNALRVLNRERAAVAEAVPGTRNTTLNRAAFTIGGLIASGELDPEFSRDVLLAAAEDSNVDGLWPRDEMEKCCDAALAAGSASPWNAAPPAGWREAGRGRTADPAPVAPVADLLVPLPLDAFPKEVAALAEYCDTYVGTPPGYVAMASLAALGAALGGHVTFDLEPRWHIPPSFYVALVGRPGTKKTPAMTHALSPARAASDRLQGLDGGDLRILVEDATYEALSANLKNNDRGVLLAEDELSSFFAGMGQYKEGSGADRAFYLKIWNGGAVRQERIKRGSTFIPNANLNVVGGVQPDVFEALTMDKSDGMLDRFLYAFAEPTPRKVHRGARPTDVLDAYDALWDRLRSDEANMLGRAVTPTEEAREAYYDFVDECEFLELPEHLATVGRKMYTHATRIALVLACCDGATQVERQHIERARQIVLYSLGQMDLAYTSTDSANRDVLQWAKNRDSLRRYLEAHEAEHGRLPSHREALQFGPRACRKAAILDPMLNELGVTL